MTDQQINKKLATEVMGALKGFRMEARRDEYGSFTQVPTNATYAMPRGKVILQSDWNPISDLNQLRECYEAASVASKESYPALFYTAFQEIYKEYFKVYPGTMSCSLAWVKHPRLVALAILKAAGVEVE